MSEKFEIVEVPWVMMGNRRGLTAAQLRENEWLMDFYKQFKDCFEPLFDCDAVVFIERGQPTNLTGNEE